MADAKNPDTTDEPSMEEILASIRRIIADEKQPEEGAPEEAPVETAEEDILELTQAVEEDGTIKDLNVSEPEPAPKPEPVTEAPPQMDDNLVSDTAATAAISSLETLAQSAHVERPMTTSRTPLGEGGRTLEDMVLELIRPLLKDWLDANLPPIVERIVQKEVERIARRVQE